MKDILLTEYSTIANFNRASLRSIDFKNIDRRQKGIFANFFGWVNSSKGKENV